MTIEKIIFEEFSRLSLDDANDLIRQKYSKIEGHDQTQAKLDALDYIRILQTHWVEEQERLLEFEKLDMTSEINKIQNICRLALKGEWEKMSDFLISEAEEWEGDITDESHHLATSLRNLSKSVYLKIE